MHKNLFGIASVIGSLAALVLAGAVFIHVLPSSQAQDFGPVVTGGEAPWISLAGSLTASASTDVYTVPADRSFVLTGLCTSTIQQNVFRVSLAGTEEVARGQTGTHTCNSSFASGYLARGQGHAVFGPGESVRIHNYEATNREFSLQGYLAAP